MHVSNPPVHFRHDATVIRHEGLFQRACESGRGRGTGEDDSAGEGDSAARATRSGRATRAGRGPAREGRLRYGASTSRGRPPSRTITLEPMIVTTTAPRIAA